MKIDLLLVGCPLARVPEVARQAEAAGYDGMFVAELTRRGQDHLERRAALDGVAIPALRDA